MSESHDQKDKKPVPKSGESQEYEENTKDSQIISKLRKQIQAKDQKMKELENENSEHISKLQSQKQAFKRIHEKQVQKINRICIQKQSLKQSYDLLKEEYNNLQTNVYGKNQKELIQWKQKYNKQKQISDDFLKICNYQKQNLQLLRQKYNIQEDEFKGLSKRLLQLDKLIKKLQNKQNTQFQQASSILTTSQYTIQYEGNGLDFSFAQTTTTTPNIIFTQFDKLIQHIKSTYPELSKQLVEIKLTLSQLIINIQKDIQNAFDIYCKLAQIISPNIAKKLLLIQTSLKVSASASVSLIQDFKNPTINQESFNKILAISQIVSPPNIKEKLLDINEEIKSILKQISGQK